MMLSNTQTYNLSFSIFKNFPFRNTQTHLKTRKKYSKKEQTSNYKQNTFYKTLF